MVVNNYRPALQGSAPEKRKSKVSLKWILLGLVLIGIGIALGFVAYEANTSRFQAKEIAGYAATLTYKLESGPSDAIVFPPSGPFDRRLGYTQLPGLLQRVQAQGMQIEYQTRFSPALLNYASYGFFTPYPEKTQTGLSILDSRGEPVYSFSYPRRVYAAFDSVPPLVVQSLLFVENRDLLSQDRPYMNPAVDWIRFSKASMHQAARYIGLDYSSIGGSTLATQLEKFRHSPEGITEDARSKINQMVSASIRTYQTGPETYDARKNIVLSYVNTVPLSGAPGYGEVHGIGDGLHVWFDSNVEKINQLLVTNDSTESMLPAKGQALRQVLSLMIAQRRPSFYLSESGRDELNRLTGGYLRLLANNSYISPKLRDAGLAEEISFRDFGANPAIAPMDNDKAATLARMHLSGLLGKSLYDLDRMDLVATTTLRNDLQEQVSKYLQNLSDPAFARETGVLGEHMLTPDRTKSVLYSFTLFERTPSGNLVRVQTDNTDQPFDLNEGSKLELGSTAKLRVLVSYLEVIAEAHQRYAGLDHVELRKLSREPQDRLSQWTLHYLLTAKDKSLTGILNASLERRYSASPYEPFFTGGGIHYFHNYRDEDNNLSPTVREAFQRSVNLSFVRIMRDVVNYTTYQQVENAAKLLADESDPRRKEYLSRFADREGKLYLRRFWNKYKNHSDKERFDILLEDLRKDEVRLSVVHRFLYPEKKYAEFEQFIRQYSKEPGIDNKRMHELYERYGPDAYTLADQGYLARRHPLELWLLSYLQNHPESDWSDVVAASEDERQDVYKWLLRTRYKNARDSRIRTLLELDAFKDIQKRWNRLGYPFDNLVPSLATALGSSGDRPEALAELMGIVVNNGIKQPTVRIQELHFASQTPYETNVKWKPQTGEQVLMPEVASIVREALTEVVDVGTARRLQGGFTKNDGAAFNMGGKTGTGDNRHVTLSSKGYRVASRAVNRTATFVFFLGKNHFGTLTAFVPGQKAEDFSFTSSLPVQVLKGMAPILQPYLEMKANDTIPEDLKNVMHQVKLSGDKSPPVSSEISVNAVR